MEYPVCLADSCVGTLYVCPRGEETELRAVCRGTEKGLYRLYVQGNRGEVLLGVTEDGGLRRCFSRELLANHIRTCVVRDIQDGKLEVVDDLLSTIQKLMK